VYHIWGQLRDEVLAAKAGEAAEVEGALR
jgi:hypothetical protein